MSRKLEPGKIVAATHNPGKVKELSALLEPFGFNVVSAGDLNLPEPEETEDTFVGNAELKALAAAKASDEICLADDSGLAVQALGGAPGIYSARWAGPEKDFSLAMKKVNDALIEEHGPDEEGDRRARFVCVLSVAWPDGHVESFEGEVRGRIVWPPRGENGFGYDPIFSSDGSQQTFGEMDPDAKHAISHRADAFAKFKTKLSKVD